MSFPAGLTCFSIRSSDWRPGPRISIPMAPLMQDITGLFERIGSNDSVAVEELFHLTYKELRSMAATRMAREQPGITLQATALVHEVFMRLAGGAEPLNFENRRHFFAAAGEAMRRILIEGARQRKTLRRGKDLIRCDQESELLLAPDADPGELLAVHDMLDSLSKLHPRHADVVKLRYFVGCTFDEIGEIQGRSADAVRDDWVFARAWLKREWTKGDHGPTN